MKVTQKLETGAMSVRSKITIGVVIVVLILSVVLLRKPVQRTLPYLKQIEQVLSVYSQTEDIFAMFFDLQDEMKEIQAQNRALEEAKKESNALVLELVEEVRMHALVASQAGKKADSLLGIIHEPTYEPEDFEECLAQLDSARTVVNTLYSVVEEYQIQVRSLESQNLSQGLIIAQKDVFIGYQEEQILLWRSLYETKRRRHIIITTGLVVVAYTVGSLL